MEIKIKKLRPDAHIPTRGSKKAAGYDLHACFDGGEKIIPAGGTVLIGTGLSVAVPDGYFAAIFARSGLALKQSLRPANCVGVCDSDYRGEYMVPLRNDGECDRVIKNGDRIAQMVIMPYLDVTFDLCDNLDETERGDGGFGSTGIGG